MFPRRNRVPKQTSLSGLPPTPASGPLPFNSGLRCIVRTSHLALFVLSWETFRILHYL